jgi:hypothetical protein
MCYQFMDSHFSVQKMVQDEKSPFQFGKWFEISDGHAFSSSKICPDRTIIFIMKMVR